MPYSIRIFKKCTEYNIDFNLVRHLHFFDLECIIMQFEIQKIEEYLERKEKERLKEQGISDIKKISGNEALKMLGR